MFKYYIILCMFFVSCGTANNQTSKNAANAQKGATPALYVADESQRPECTETALDWLIYQADVAEFLTCQEAGWEVVDIRGKDGAEGKSGKDGANGATGPQGERGEKGETGEAPLYGWLDPITGSHWIKMTGAWNQTVALTLCSGFFELPGEDDLYAAAIHGLTVALPIGNGSDVSLGWASGSSRAVQIQPTVSSPQTVGSTANPYSVYCVKP